MPCFLLPCLPLCFRATSLLPPSPALWHRLPPSPHSLSSTCVPDGLVSPTGTEGSRCADSAVAHWHPPIGSRIRIPNMHSFSSAKQAWENPRLRMRSHIVWNTGVLAHTSRFCGKRLRKTMPTSSSLYLRHATSLIVILRSKLALRKI
jgi:hypothetical protein